ncbi:uncharacterized protein BDV17DRAFT_130797 [Aspergillus undulatus]|uniref:uncharacterized protein n=1 Tax=Aspergillus undulatus TaxID=1810928 RepID=UPI003CCDE9C7
MANVKKISSYTVQALYPPEKWRSLLRSLLRESSYLPDPIARSTCHDQVLRRFRRLHEERNPRVKQSTERMKNLQRDARKSLSVLQRANEGYTRPLEKVLKFAYGRIGRRRVEMLENLLRTDSPQDSEAVSDLVKGPSRYGEGWRPPQALVDLLKSQRQNPAVSQFYDRPLVKAFEPLVDEKNAWGRKMSLDRRKNIRRLWYKDVAQALLPPLPDAELEILEGLISRRVSWTPPRRRSKSHSTPADAGDVDPRGQMLRKVLTDGPPKDETFAPYIDGRPHKITRRFMSRLWQRISCLVPRHHWDAEKGRHIFEWDKMALPQLALSATEESSPRIFTGLNTPADPREKRAAAKSRIMMAGCP